VHDDQTIPTPEGCERPPKPLRHMSIRDLRRVVIARHKMLGSTKPPEEAMELITEEYGADADSAKAFVEWLRGGSVTEPPSKGALERRHVTTDPETGEESYLETEPGSIPPRPVR
jgi:hypothetical protein